MPGEEDDHPEMKRGGFPTAASCKGCTARPPSTAWDGLLRAAPLFFLDLFPSGCLRLNSTPLFLVGGAFRLGCRCTAGKEGALGLCVNFEHRRGEGKARSAHRAPFACRISHGSCRPGCTARPASPLPHTALAALRRQGSTICNLSAQTSRLVKVLIVRPNRSTKVFHGYSTVDSSSAYSPRFSLSLSLSRSRCAVCPRCRRTPSRALGRKRHRRCLPTIIHTSTKRTRTIRATRALLWLSRSARR